MSPAFNECGSLPWPETPRMPAKAKFFVLPFLDAAWQSRHASDKDFNFVGACSAWLKAFKTSFGLVFHLYGLSFLPASSPASEAGTEQTGLPATCLA